MDDNIKKKRIHSSGYRSVSQLDCDLDEFLARLHELLKSTDVQKNQIKSSVYSCLNNLDSWIRKIQV